LSTFIKRFFIVLAILVVGLFIFVASELNNLIPKQYSPYDNHGKYRPVVNKHPRYFMTIDGHIDRNIKKFYIIADYSTINTKCNVVTNGLEGVSSERMHDDKFDINKMVDSKGHFKLKIALDKYKPGFCNWRDVTILYANPSKEGGNPLTNITQRAKKTKQKSGQFMISCDKKNSECAVISYKPIGNDWNASVPFDTYHLHLHIENNHD